jgi:hypothetical protein
LIQQGTSCLPQAQRQAVWLRTINQQSGALTPVALEEVGHQPAAVLATRIG